MDLDRYLDGMQSRRMKAEDRFLARDEKRRAEAHKMIGELLNDRFYVFPIGGKYREGTYAEMVNYLMRNRWV
jgi:hypothetical protein